MTLRQQPIRQMRPQKTSAAGDDGNGQGISGVHYAFCLTVAAQVYQQEILGK